MSTYSKAPTTAAGGKSRWPEYLRAAISTGWLATRRSAGTALLAATGGVVVMLVARLIFGIPTPTEIFGDRITTIIPLGLFSTLLRVFGQDAKHFFFAGLLIGQGIATAALLSLYWGARAGWKTAYRTALRTPRAPRGFVRDAAAQTYVRKPTTPTVSSREVKPRPVDVLGFAGAYWVATACLLAPLVGGGMFGTGLSSGALGFLGAEVVPALTSGGLFIWLLSREDALTLARSRAAGTLSRRRVLRQAGFAFALLAGTAVVWEIVQKGAASLGLAGTGGSAPPLNISSTPDQITPPPVPVYGSWTPVVGQTTEVTSTTRFYYVSKNLVGDPAIDSGQWQLQITGLIDHAKTFSFADIQAMPQVQRYQTLECISNEVGGDLMSTTLWTGTRIADILMAAGIQAGASQMIFHCADGYSDRHHLSQALDPRALIVYAMNGQPLPQAHGFPARLLIPGRYGMKNGKWVTSLELATGDYQGYWEQQGWTSEAVVKLTSRIDVPGDGELLERRPINLAGVAFAGDQGIGRVEVSTDAGQTWTAAHLKRPLSDLTWVLWELPWSPPPGSHVVAVRAIDLAGRMQTSQTATPLPDGATGYHAITVTVG